MTLAARRGDDPGWAGPRFVGSRDGTDGWVADFAARKTGTGRDFHDFEL
jgi:hypothetical protein